MHFGLKHLITVIIAASASFAGSSFAEPQQRDPAPAPPEPIAQLLSQLSSPRFSEREAATKRLIETKAARPFVEALLQSPDADLSERARLIVLKHARFHAVPRMKRYLAYGRNGEIERMIAGLSQWEGPLDMDELWQGIHEVAAIVRDRSPLAYQGQNGSRYLGLIDTRRQFFQYEQLLPHWVRLTKPETETINARSTIADGQLIDARSIHSALVISNADVSCRSVMNFSIVLTNGDFTLGARPAPFVCMHTCLIISSGSVTIRGDLSNSLVLAKGKIRVEKGVRLSHSHIETSDSIEEPPTKDKTSIASVRKQKPLDFIRWFVPEDLGLSVRIDCAGVKVTRIQPGSVAARAGLMIDDVIANVCGVEVESAELFRRQLLTASIADTSRLTVNRNNKMMQVDLDFVADGENRKK